MQSYLHIIMDSVKFDEDIIHYHRAAANGGCLTQLTTIIAIIYVTVYAETRHLGLKLILRYGPKTLPTAYSSENAFFTQKCCMMSAEHGYVV